MMKRILVAFLFVGTFAQAQQEVKFDFFDAFVMKSLEVDYEFYLNKESSVGGAILYNFSKSKFKYNEKTMVTPFFRYYIPEEMLPIAENVNLFGELFLGINSGNTDIEKKNNEGNIVKDENGKKMYENKDYTDGALGIGGGIKYISELGFAFEAHAGIGRNLFGEYSPAVVPRVGLCVGYQF